MKGRSLRNLAVPFDLSHTRQAGNQHRLSAPFAAPNDTARSGSGWDPIHSLTVNLKEVGGGAKL